MTQPWWQGYRIPWRLSLPALICRSMYRRVKRRIRADYWENLTMNARWRVGILVVAFLVWAGAFWNALNAQTSAERAAERIAANGQRITDVERRVAQLESIQILAELASIKVSLAESKSDAEVSRQYLIGIMVPLGLLLVAKFLEFRDKPPKRG